MLAHRLSRPRDVAKEKVFFLNDGTNPRPPRRKKTFGSPAQAFKVV
jgi:hypothetical protein